MHVSACNLPMLFFNISSLNSKINWYDPNLVPITLHWSKWPFHTGAQKSIPLYNKCQGRRATYNLWQSKHYLQMKSPMTRTPRQFLHDGRCLCLPFLSGDFCCCCSPPFAPVLVLWWYFFVPEVSGRVPAAGVIENCRKLSRVLTWSWNKRKGPSQLGGQVHFPEPCPGWSSRAKCFQKNGYLGSRII